MVVHRANPRALILLFVTCLALGTATSAVAAPPDVKSFNRKQLIKHLPKPGALLRIWMIYIGQGDAIFIEFPRGPTASFDAAGLIRGNASDDPVEMLIDGGAIPVNETARLARFLTALRPSPFLLDYVVISHHDQDHAEGIIGLLELQKKFTADKQLHFGTIFHNGLASYAGGHRGFPDDHVPKDSVADGSSTRFIRGMALLEQAPGQPPTEKKIFFQRNYLINTIDDLDAGLSDDDPDDPGDFQGVYLRLAQAVIGARTKPGVQGFERAFLGHPPIDVAVPNAEVGTPNNVHIEFVWPREQPRKYTNWAHTINGNSVALHLSYGDFTMYFTGDMNLEAEEDQMKLLHDRPEIFDSDVLKVPHHGSEDGFHEFFAKPPEQPDGKWQPRPVLAIASMGKGGFGNPFFHPRAEIVEWLGGAHRVYHTHIQEKKFAWDELKKDAEKKQDMLEGSHILIETDGKWFRLVEIHDKDPPALPKPIVVPPVDKVRRSDGTRWISAK